METVDNIAALRQRAGSVDRTTIRVLGMVTANDGFAADYYWDSALASDNGNTLVKVTSMTTGGWVKQVTEPTTVSALVATISNTTTETTIFSRVIRAGEMGNNKSARFRIVGQLSSGLVTPTITIRIKFGTAVLTVASVAGVSINLASSKPIIIEGAITNQGAANSQYIMTEIRQGNTAVPLSLSEALAGADWNIDTTVDQMLSCTVQFGSAISTTVFVPKTMNVLIR